MSVAVSYLSVCSPYFQLYLHTLFLSLSLSLAHLVNAALNMETEISWSIYCCMPQNTHCNSEMLKFALHGCRSRLIVRYGHHSEKSDTLVHKFFISMALIML